MDPLIITMADMADEDNLIALLLIQHYASLEEEDEEDDDEEEEEEDFSDDDSNVPIPQEIMIQKRKRDDEDEFRPLGLKRYRRNDRRIPRFELPSYENSAFSKLFKSIDDQKLLNCCGVDHKVFAELLKIFQPAFNMYGWDSKTGALKKRTFTKNGIPKGRKREIDATGALGLVLHWYRTRGPITRAFAAGWGMTATSMYAWLKFSRRVLLQFIQYHPKAEAAPPTDTEVESYAAAISAKHPILAPKKVWGALGEMKIPLRPLANYENKNAYQNESVGGTCVNNLFVFAPDGRIRLYVVNAPGSWDDVFMADNGIYETVKDVHDRLGGRVVVDSNFEIENEDFVIRSTEQVDSNTPEIRKAATAVQELSEHGIRMIQGQFPRLKDAMGVDKGFLLERKIILKLMVHLYNYQISTIGTNKVLNSLSHTRSRTCAVSTRKLVAITETANNVFDKNNNN